MKGRYFRYGYILLVVALFIIGGCSNGAQSPGIPPLEEHSAVAVTAGNHMCWGLWQFAADPVRGTLDIAQLRAGDMHLNALVFLEPPALVNLTLESLKFVGNIIEADIGLRHPFLGLTEFSGFDVCGILITNGSVTGFSDPGLRMAGPGDTRLLNPDGWTRWWNPAEFPVNTKTMYAYNDGLLGTPDAVANYNSTLNAYKYFCDELGADDPLTKVTPSKRGLFSAGQKNIRHYTIDMGAGLTFNYAIDASWQFPTGQMPWVAPDDFAPAANRVEAWNITITELENTLWNDGSDSGGGLSLLIDVWDHYNAGLNAVTVESQGNFVPVTSTTAIGGGAGYSTYQVDITEATPAPDSISLLITVASEATGYQELLPGKAVSVYFMHSSAVDDKPQGPPECGTGIHGTPTYTPFTDFTQMTVALEMAWLVSGPYAGEMLMSGELKGATGSVRRYNMDSIGSHAGQVFVTLPPGTVGPFWGFIYHLEVEPRTGRVIVVPDGLGVNNSLLIYDDAGSLLSPATGISVGPERRIAAMDANKNGDLWMLTIYRDPSTGKWHQSRLERWIYQSGPPYYIHDESSDLPMDEIIGYYNEKDGKWYPANEILDLVILYPEQRMFIFQAHWSAGNNGKLKVFGINATGPPTHLDALDDDSLLTNPTWIGGNDYFRATFGGIWCDHSDVKLDGCRVIVFCRTYHPGFKATVARIDRDGKVLNEAVYDYNGYNNAAVNEDINPAKNHLILFGDNYNQCYMSSAPSDW